ncbi:MAG: hypothetical protein R6U98_29565 [Pirellulaceae bacterium]
MKTHVRFSTPQRFSFDTVLIPMNVADSKYLSFQHNTLPLAREQKLGVIGMKIPVRGRLLRNHLFSSIAPLLRYAIVGCGSLAELEENVAVVRNFSPLQDHEERRISEMAAGIDKRIEGYKKGIEDDSWRNYVRPLS